MAHFYGTVKGTAGEATRRGSKTFGLVTTAASWSGAVRVELEHRDGTDYATVALVPWQNSGVHRVLYAGPINAADDRSATSRCAAALDTMAQIR